MEQHIETLALAHGTQTIGENQRTLNFTEIASGGDGLLNFTFDDDHGLKKGQCFYNQAGDYEGVYRVKRVISPTVVQVTGTFVATDTGSVVLTAALDIFGFYVNAVPLTITELEPYYQNDDVESIIATTYIPGQFYPIQCKKIRIVAGEITVIRKPAAAQLSYTNR